MTARNGNTTKPRLETYESNPDPIRDKKDLDEFSKLLAQEKVKVLKKK